MYCSDRRADAIDSLADVRVLGAPIRGSPFAVAVEGWKVVPFAQKGSRMTLSQGGAVATVAS